MLHLVLALAVAPPAADRLPLTNLPPAVPVANLCRYRYPLSTRSPDCQRLCDQAFGYYYSYVWMEAARSFETALRHDPDCALAWLGLHRSLEKWGKKSPQPNPPLAVLGGPGQPHLPPRFAKAPHEYALERAQALIPKASHREGMLVTARLQEKGMLPGIGPDERKKKAQQTLDELLTLYPDDEEGWFARAQVTGITDSSGFAPNNAAAPFYHALLRLNPVHPGANHELVHYFENIRRPALGWPFAEKYIESSPGLPHAFHMQAHLAMRVGKWQRTTDWSQRAVELEREYHRAQGVDPKDDHQFQHHMETLTRSLVHDGRFAEAKKVKEQSSKYGYAFRPEWFRMAVAEGDWAEAEKQAAEARKKDRLFGTYLSAVLALERDDLPRARAEADVLREAQQAKRGKREQELRLWEVQGRLLCRTGDGAGGVKLLKRVIEKTKDDYAHHAWGGGAYFMEAWGGAALDAGLADEAEEAFLEALAHDAGSVRGALGLWAAARRQGREAEAERYLKLAGRCWARADAPAFERRKDESARRADRLPTTAVAESASGAASQIPASRGP